MIVALVLFLLAAFGFGVWIGRKSMTVTGSPTPPTANAVAVETVEDSDAAAQAATDAAEKKADEVLHAPDADIDARVAKLRARGRAGE